MTRPDPKRIVLAHRRKTAGEVRFIKDRSNDKSEWGWGTPGPIEREIQEDFIFNPRYLKPLALTMRSALMALGHATSAHARFVKIKSRNISPDGSLGGKGYIAKIPEMRRQLMNCVEALSAITDTIYDELNAPHWNPAEDELDSRDREEVKDIVDEAEEIREDPEGWAREEEEEEAEEFQSKKASARRVMSRFARLLNTDDMAPASVRDAPQLWDTVNDLQRVLIGMQHILRKVGYWSENIVGDLKSGQILRVEVPALAQELNQVIAKLRGPQAELERSLREQITTQPRYASVRADLERAIRGLESSLPSSRTATIGDPDLTELVGSLRSVSKHLRQVLENGHV